MGFVSNSSSSSFVVKKEFITPYEMKVILNPLDYFEEICKYKYEHEVDYISRRNNDPSLEQFIKEERSRVLFDNPYDFDAWEISNKTNEIKFSCMLDNFDYLEYIEWLGVDKRALR